MTTQPEPDMPGDLNACMFLNNMVICKKGKGATEYIRADIVEKMAEGLEQIKRMSLYPDDKINRFTLVAAIKIACQALAAYEESRK